MLSADELNSLDPVAYVRSVAPFHAVPDALFEDAARSLEIGFFPAGTRLVTARGPPLQHLYVIRCGSVRLELNGKVLQELEEGELFGYTSLVTGRAVIDVVVVHDLLAYRIPAPQFEALLADGRFAAHFAVGLTDRLRASLEPAASVQFTPDLAVPVEQLVRRPAQWVEREADVRAVAVLMREHDVSSVLVRGDPEGIVTDRDLRNRVLARDLGPATLVKDVCSSPVRTVAAETPVYDAWRVLLDARVNHLAVRRGSDILGVVTATDLLKHSARGPIAMLRRIERLASRDSVSGYGEKVVEMASALLASGLDASVVGGLVARLDDALLRRILTWAEGEFGDAPGPYAWIALGAEGRREQVLLTARDDAVVYDDAARARHEWYERLVDRVDADLVRAGFPPPLRSTAAAESPKALDDFTRMVDSCLRQAPLEAAPLFDGRRAAGHLELEPVERVLARAGSDARLLSDLAAGALGAGASPATPGERARSDDVRQGIAWVVGIARCLAIELGSRSRSTLERLEDALRAGIMSERSHATVTEAYRLLVGIDVRQQLRAIAASEGRGVASRDLSTLEHTRVKDALRTVKRWCGAAAERYAGTD